MLQKKGKITIGLLLSFLLVFIFTSVVGASEEKPWERYDLEGRTVRLAGRDYGDGVVPYRNLNFGGRISYEDPEVQEHINDIEEKFNCNIEFVEIPGSWPDLLESFQQDVISGDPRADLYPFNWWWEPLVLEEMAYPLDDVLDEDFYERLPDLFQEAAVSYRGRAYGAHINPNPIYTGMMFFNKDILEREGVISPYELMEDDNWTWETMKEIALEVTRDTTGDGEINQWAFSHRLSHNYWAQFLFTNNAQLYTLENGRYKYSFDEPEAIEGMEFIQDSMEKGLIKVGGSFLGGDIAFNFTGRTLYDLTQQGYVEMEDDFGIVPMPQGPNADNYKYLAVRPLPGLIPLSIDEGPETIRGIIEVVMALTEFGEPYMSEEEWYEKIVYQESIRDKKSIENLKKALKEQEKMEWIWYLANKAQDEFPKVLDDIRNLERDPATALAEVAPVMQSAIDEAFGQ